MNRDTLIEFAKQAGFIVDDLSRQYQPNCIQHTWYLVDEGLIRFAALVAQHERNAIMDEWWMSVQADLENGVKSLNELAAEKWSKEYPEISKFASVIEKRGE